MPRNCFLTPPSRARSYARADTGEGGTDVLDVLMVVLTVVAFAALFALIAGLERV
jgi:hypothetical protein